VLSVSRRDDQPASSAAIKTIVCPVNFTGIAREALDYAAHLADAFHADLAVLHVVEQRDELHASADEARFRGWIDAAIQNRCTYREIVLRGGAAERVLDFAEDANADLIVIGAQHKLFRDEAVIGTTTERLVRFARLPVLSIPRPVSSAVNAPEEAAALVAG